MSSPRNARKTGPPAAHHRPAACASATSISRSPTCSGRSISIAACWVSRMTTSRPGAAFISAGGYHHHLGLNTWESRGGSPPAPGTTGLYHTAILYPTRRLLADALTPADRRQDPARRRQRPRRLRGALSARPGRQRRRALLGPAEGEVAAEAGRLAADVHPPARPARSAGGAGQADSLTPLVTCWRRRTRSDDSCGPQQIAITATIA